MRLSSSANKTNRFITGSDLLATSKLLSAQKGEETTKRTPEKNESESYVSVKCSFASKDNRHSSFITLTDNHSQSSHMDQSQQRCVSALSCTPAHIHTYTHTLWKALLPAYWVCINHSSRLGRDLSQTQQIVLFSGGFECTSAAHHNAIHYSSTE